MVQSNTILLEEIFENFWNKCIETYETDSARFLLAPEVVWQAFLKKSGEKLELLADTDMLQMVVKGNHR